MSSPLILPRDRTTLSGTDTHLPSDRAAVLQPAVPTSPLGNPRRRATCRTKNPRPCRVFHPEDRKRLRPKVDKPDFLDFEILGQHA